MTPSTREELKKILDRHVELGVESIFSAVYSGPNISTLSFYHLINRIMMVVQVPITFVVFLDVNGLKSAYHRTNHHKRHQKDIDKVVARISGASDEFHFPIWHSENGEHQKYTLVALKADPTYKFAPIKPIHCIEDVFDLWDAASYKLWHVLQAKSYARYDDSFFKILPETLKSLEYKEEPSPPERVPAAEEVVEAFNKELLKDSTRYLLTGRGVLDRVFRKIERNISQVNRGNTKHADSGVNLANFILFARDYSGCPARGWRHHDNYDYALRILLCSSQRAELESYLKWMLDKREKCEGEFLAELTAAEVKHGVELIHEANALFWDYLEKGNSKALLDIFGNYFSEHARSMADPVFDGVSFYRQPFAHDAGLGRVFDPQSLPASLSDLPPDDKRKDDLLRVVICQYLFQGFAAKGKGNDKLQLQVMLNPIEIGGKVWGVVGFATRSHHLGFKFKFDRKEHSGIADYDMFWSKNYHMYRDVNERFKKNLRSYMNRFYEDFIASRGAAWVARINAETSSGSKVNIFDAVAEFNATLASLACLFPYNVVKATVSPDEDRHPVPSSFAGVPEDGGRLGGERIRLTGERRVLLAEHLGMFMEVTNCSLFPPAHGVSLAATRGFVDEVDVAVAMTDWLLRWIVSMPDQRH